MSYDASNKNITRNTDPTSKGHDKSLGELAQETTIRLKNEERTRCEIWTRVMGYHRPVHTFNPGKKAEHKQRTLFIERPRTI